MMIETERRTMRVILIAVSILDLRFRKGYPKKRPGFPAAGLLFKQV